MLEVKARSGSGRLLKWQHGDHVVETPCLIVPETSLGVPDADVVLTKTPAGDRFELVTTGTWFHPDDVPAGEHLVLESPRPAPTGVPQVVFVGDDLAVFHDAGGWADDPRKFVEPFITACEEATMGRVLYAPALGKPADYAVYAYLGVDAFDASTLLIAATRGECLTPDGTLSVAEARAIYGDLDDSPEGLAAFNIQQAMQELARIRAAIRQGRLRHLAERRAHNSPDAVALLRRFDHEWLHLESRSPTQDTQDVPCMTWDSLWMPEVERFRQRMRDDYLPPEADILVLLPCSARKPYRLSQTHRYFARALDDSGARHRVHEVMVTSPLGIVPRDLEDTYPANRYDVPVTGHWNRDEEAIIRQQVMALLDKREYAHVVCHTDTKTWSILRDILPEHAVHTATHGRPSSMEDCQALRDKLREIRDLPVPEGQAAPTRDIFAGGKARKIEDLKGLLSMQFGADVAQALTDGAEARGRVPFVKLFRDGVQLGQTTQDTGKLSLTLDGAAIVAGLGRKRVFQGDFEIKKTGSLFAAGIEDADGDVRPGDEVVVMRGEELVGCGVAQMTADEMKHLGRGIGVNLRHIVKKQEVTA